MRNITLIGIFIASLIAPNISAQSLINDPCTTTYPVGSEITINAPCVNVSTAGMTNLFNPGTCGSSWNQPDGWAWFQGDGSTVDITYVSTLNDPIIHVFTISTTPCTFSSSLCADNTGSGGTETINLATTAGVYYLIMIEEQFGDLGNITTGCLSVSNPIPPVLGCTNPLASNFNPLATVDDGSCAFLGVDYLMPTVGINSEYVGSCLVSDCGPSTFTDDGGYSGNYSNNIGDNCGGGSACGIYRVFCPDAAGQCMQVTFNSFVMANTFDYLQVKNGPTQNSPTFTTAPSSATAYAGITGLNSDLSGSVPFSYTATGPSGCLTFRNYTSGVNTAAGWDATLQCVPCAGGPNGTDNNDCITMTPLCSSVAINANATGPGIVAEGCTGATCPAGGENHTSWYTFTAQTTGTLNITIVPNVGTGDYDFAVYGPNVTCGALGAPIRCTDSGATGTTGLTATAGDNTEDVTGDSFLQTMNVTAGESYILVVDEWSPTSAGGYNLSFGGTASLDCTVLPIELSEFTAEFVPEENVVDLFWITETERDNDHFDVERSTDGINFEVIRQLKGAGTTQNETQYYTIDPEPYIGVNYYRLNQFDINGDSDYSDVRTVNVLADYYDMLSLFPNPTTGKTEVIFNSYTKEAVKLTVIGYDGRIIVNTSLDALPGGNRFDLDMTSQQKGVYIITITTRDKVYTTKLVKN